MPLTKIISGMQTGADLAGVDAALSVGYTTGGWMPKGFRNKTGNHPEFAKIYNAKESGYYGYANRTRLNVGESDATLIFAGNPNSAGTKCTLSAIDFFNKTFRLIQPSAERITIGEILEWLYLNNVKILNIAGNSEDNWPGVYDYTYKWMIGLLTLDQESKCYEQNCLL